MCKIPAQRKPDIVAELLSNLIIANTDELPSTEATKSTSAPKLTLQYLVENKYFLSYEYKLTFKEKILHLNILREGQKLTRFCYIRSYVDNSNRQSSSSMTNQS